MIHSRLAGIAAILSICSLISAEADDQPGGPGRAPAAAIVWQYNGRVNLATGTVYGYFTQIYGLSQADLFNGNPGESTARFTLLANIQAIPVQPNGTALQSFLVQPGDFTVYFTANPTSRTWTDPSTFINKNGVVAVFSRTLDQQTIMGPISTNTASGTLKSSTPFLVNSRMFDFGRVIPDGVSNVTTGPNIPQENGAFAFAGFGLAIGK
jgi:hypothetical protein